MQEPQGTRVWSLGHLECSYPYALGSCECHVLLENSFLKYGCWWRLGPICSLFCLSMWNHFRWGAVRVSILLWAFLSISRRADTALLPEAGREVQREDRKLWRPCFQLRRKPLVSVLLCGRVFMDLYVSSHCLWECVSNVAVGRPPWQGRLWQYFTQ